MSTYPSTISTITDPQATDRLNSPSHSSIEQAQNDAIKKIETFVGTTSSAVGTLMYNIRASASDGGGHVQTANKGGTGQTSFNKGDTLVATSSSVIAKLAVGADGTVPIADSNQAAGIVWGNPTGINIQSVVGSVGGACSSVWSKPSNVGIASKVLVQVWGGGGSGSSRTGTEESGGGGGGGYAEFWFPVSVLGSTELVVVGQGGASVTSGTNAGQAGGITVFGTTSSLITAYGGGAAQSGTGGGGGGGGAGIFSSGENGNGDTPGNAGSPGSVWGGQGDGGLGIYGGGGGRNGGGGGVAFYGGGGGGGVSSTSAGNGGTSRLGGNGGKASIQGAATAGSIPGGGGGGSYGGLSGAGGPGKAIITTFF